MIYQSTRSSKLKQTPHEAVIHGLAEDGGLYVPSSVDFHFNPQDFLHKSYQQIASVIIKAFLDDYTDAELQSCIENAYDNRFDNKAVVPVTKTEDGWLMELWHGPTSAFKDIALTILPNLLTAAYQKEHSSDTIAILTATSGDTGKAALSGFANVPHTAVTVFYPLNGVSAIQQRQMITSRGDNVQVIAVEGNFDDCQRMVKQAMDDPDVIKAGHHVTLSSANSINIGRLVPQIVYYYSSYAKLVEEGAIRCGDEVSFVVPTGNFGDILAGWLAKKTGLPVKKLICASNANHVLTDFIRTGTYNAERPFYQTMSPSMDILISSNLERMLWFASDGDDRLVASLMKELSEKGSYTVPEAVIKNIRESFDAYWTSEEECRQTIHDLYVSSKRLIDPHTAVAYHAMKQYQSEGNNEPCIVLSTASIYKFSRSVLNAISAEVPDDDFDAMDLLHEISGIPVPKGLAELKDLPVRFSEHIPVSQGRDRIIERMKELSHD